MKLVKKNSVAVAILVLVILAAGLITLNQQPKETNSENSPVASDQVSQAIGVEIKADAAAKNYQVENAVGKTALDVTKMATSDVQMTGEGANAFITGINGRVADVNKHEFWNLIINGKSSDVGAGSYIIKAGDKITWEIATY